jgi:hypothetical protein
MRAAGYNLPEGAPDDAVLCPQCDGSGWQPDRVGKCAMCGGVGWVDDEEGSDDEDGRAGTGGSKYSAAQVVALGRAGKAFRHGDGSYAFPIADREDLANAIRAVGGRASKSPPRAIRKFIMNRAKAMGLASMIPATWASDGNLKRSRPSSPSELRARAAALRGRAVELEGEQMIRRDRLRRGLPAHDGIERFRRASGMAAEARSRGDWAMARTFDAVAESEAEFAALGL